ncbi:MAG: DUF5684 domain-containing protein, partial [Synechococcales bacterium]|nr:DUF5684 domain-containing protein [Synechococcales bacterium]
TLALLPALLAQVSGDFDTDAAESAAAAGFGIGQLIFMLVLYVFVAFCTMTILNKLNYENSWFAWIPFLQNYAVFQAGDEEQALLWTILMIVPCVNIVAAIKQLIAWVKIAQKLGKTPWILLCLLIPVLGTFITFGYLAFA